MPSRVGLQAVLYVGSPGTVRASWGSVGANGISIATAPTGLIQVNAVRNVVANIEDGEADLSARFSNVEMVAQALSKWDIEVDLPYDPTDTGTSALEYSKWARVTLPVAVMDSTFATGVRGFWFDGQVLGFNQDQPLTKEMMVKLKIKPGMPPGSTASSFLAPQRVQCT